MATILISAGIGAAVGTGVSAIASAATAEDTRQEMPRSDRMPFLQGQEGSSQPLCFGPRNRVGGTVIWLPAFQEIVDEQNTDIAGQLGTGGSTQTTVVYTYLADIAIAVCEGEIVSITKVFANGKLIWSPSAVSGYFSIISGNGGPLIVEVINQNLIGWLSGYGDMLITSPVSTGVDLTIFQPGLYVTTSGYSNSNNNGVFQCTRSGTLADGRKFVNLRGFFPVNETPSGAISISQISIALPDDVANSFEQYPGKLDDASQPVNAIMSDPDYEGQLGMVGKTPAYKRTAYGVFQGLHLKEYGNRIPQLTFEVKAHTTLSLKQLLEKLFVRAGFSTTDIDADALSAVMISGYTITNPTSLKRAIDPILRTYDIVVQDQVGKLRFFFRKNATEHTINPDDLACHEFETDAPRLIEIVDENNDLIPREVNVFYLDINASLQQGSQRERRVDNTIGSDSILRVDIPFAMTSGEARTIASRELWRLWQQRQRLHLELPPSYLHMQEGDVINLTLNSVRYKAFITDIDVGANFLMKVKTLVDNGPLPEGLPGEDAVFTDIERTLPAPVLFGIFDWAPLSGSDTYTPRLYVFVSRSDPNSAWKGAQIFASTDDAVYSLVGTIGGESVIGKTTAVLGSAASEYWDLKNTLNIQLESAGSLASVTEAEVLNGSNRAIIGREVVAFQTAILQGDGTYTISKLLRGLRNTEQFMATHVTGERFILAKPLTSNYTIPESQKGALGYSKCIPIGGSLDDVDPLEHTFIAGSITPFSPAHFLTTRNASGDITYTWVRRSRADFLRLFSTVLVEEPPEEYSLNIYHPTNGLVLSVGTATGVRTYTYTQTARTAHGFTAGQNIEARVAQKHPVIGDGRQAIRIDVE